MAVSVGKEIAISLVGLTKFYGLDRGIEDVTFDVKRGEVLGFLGPNGAGKTTAMRLLVGLISPTNGQATILGKNALIQDSKLRARIGYLPGVLGLYRNMSGIDLLQFYARMRNVDCTNRINELAEKLNIDLSRKVSDLSKGNRQKLGVIQAFMHKPDVLILDEPTSGLDPLVQREFENIMRESVQLGSAVLLSSHVLSEVEHLADRVAIVRDGNLLALESIASLKVRATQVVDFTFAQPVTSTDFASLAGVTDVRVHGDTLTCAVEGSQTELLKKAIEHSVLQVHSREVSLDEIFQTIVGTQE